MAQYIIPEFLDLSFNLSSGEIYHLTYLSCIDAYSRYNLVANPELAERLMALLPVIDSLARYSYPAQQEMSSLHEVIWRVGELQNILVSVEALGSIFQSVDGKLHSQGLRILQEEIRKIQGQSYLSKAERRTSRAAL
jgi:hypothetical protein